MEENNIQNEKREIEAFIDNSLSEITLNCITKIKSTFLVMHNSFFTITNRNLIVLKCFISKNSTLDVTKFLPLIGSKLNENLYGKSVIADASVKNNTVKDRKKINSKKGSINIEAIATPIKYKNKTIGYISLTTLNNEIVNTLDIFIESLSLNIEKELDKVFLKNDLFKYMKLNNLKTNVNLINSLSGREQLITKYMLMAYSNTEIAQVLCISESTVKTYLRRIYEKCETSNRIDTTIAIICSNILGKL